LLKAGQPSRIVVVSSELHFIGEINKNDLNSDNYYWIRAYSNSKLANILFANELSKRLSGSQVTVNSLHPGVVNTKVAASFSPVFK
jgi:NAD(P)-dependent dehydrogenase (short-subunit alcohol dehydrogenase family)